MQTVKDIVEFVRTRKHKNGAYVGLPEAVHTYECPYWRVGQKHDSCICGGVELQEKIDAIFGGTENDSEVKNI